MIEVDFVIDTEELEGYLRAIWRDQLPFATSLAINRTAQEFQRVQRSHQESIFEIRQRTWFRRAVKIAPFSSKTSLAAKIAIDPPGGQQRADVITTHEKGGRIHPQRGHTRFAIPADVKRLKSGSISKTKRPKAFNFRRVSGSSQVEVYAGRQRTFMLRLADGTGGIYQRLGRGTARASSLATRRQRDVNIRTLYRFTPQATIESRLNFYENANKTVRASFERNFEDAFKRATGVGIGKRQASRIARADLFDTDRAPNRSVLRR